MSWLPLYHDMGLICAWLSSLVYAIPFIVMSPLRFLAAPQRWLQAIHDYRGTLSGAPNFAYELCLHRVPDELLGRLDLSSWRIAFNGAEPVNPGTMERFARALPPAASIRWRWRRSTALAECAVGLAFTPQRGLLVDAIDRAAFSTRGEALPAAPTIPTRCASSPAAGRCRATSCASSMPAWPSCPSGARPAAVPRPVGDLRLLAQPGSECQAVLRWLARHRRLCLPGGRRAVP